MNSSSISELLRSIKTLRDKFYAHTDKDIPLPESELIPSFDKIDSLIKELQEIVIELKSKIIKVTYIATPVSQSDYLILRDLLKGFHQNRNAPSPGKKTV